MAKDKELEKRKEELEKGLAQAEKDIIDLSNRLDISGQKLKEAASRAEVAGKELAEANFKIEELTAALMAKEPGVGAVLESTTEEEESLSDADLKLIEQACEAYGIGMEFVFNARIDRATGEAVVVTDGGTRVRYAKGDKVEPLEPIQVDGKIRKKMKAITGEKK